jgi:hypothetical protein
LSPKCDVCLWPTEGDAEYRETDEEEFHYESPARAAGRVRQFATIKDLLTADIVSRPRSFTKQYGSTSGSPFSPRDVEDLLAAGDLAAIKVPVGLDITAISSEEVAQDRLTVGHTSRASGRCVRSSGRESRRLHGPQYVDAGRR